MYKKVKNMYNIIAVMLPCAHLIEFDVLFCPFIDNKRF